jgi:hypothetical protein
MNAGNRQRIADILMDTVPDESPWRGRIGELFEKLRSEGVIIPVYCKNCKYNKFSLELTGAISCKKHIYCEKHKVYMYMGENDFCSQGEEQMRGI